MIYILQGMVAKNFSCTFVLFKNAAHLATGHHACTPTPSQLTNNILLQ